VPAEVARLETAQLDAFAHKRRAIERLWTADAAHDRAASASARAQVREDERRMRQAKKQATALVAKVSPGVDAKDADYIFIRFVLDQFPHGLVGLLIAVILCAAMSSSAGALSALGSTTVVDFYRLSIRPNRPDAHYLAAARIFTALWGAFAVGFAGFAALLDNLIQAVNILGSLFYGPMLGVFALGFLTKRVRGTSAFVATLCGQASVLLVFGFSRISFLWYNVIGCAVVIVLALLFESASPRTSATA
jgi:Na+/proline symporter